MIWQMSLLTDLTLPNGVMKKKFGQRRDSLADAPYKYGTREEEKETFSFLNARRNGR